MLSEIAFLGLFTSIIGYLYILWLDYEPGLSAFMNDSMKATYKKMMLDRYEKQLKNEDPKEKKLTKMVIQRADVKSEEPAKIENKDQLKSLFIESKGIKVETLPSEKQVESLNLSDSRAHRINSETYNSLNTSNERGLNDSSTTGQHNSINSSNERKMKEPPKEPDVSSSEQNSTTNSTESH